jgi:hypothetical protein
MAYTIKGGVSFPAGGEPCQKFKDWVAEHGIKTPFDPKTTIFSKGLPEWIKLQDKDGKACIPTATADKIIIGADEI